MKRIHLKQITAVILCIVVLLSLFSISLIGTLAENTPTAIGIGTKLTDNGSINNWKSFFNTNVMNTASSNRVWTDKSVFASAKGFKAMQNAATVNSAYEALETNQDNFLISLSAMASTTEITGYTGTPTDTVLILDLSQSMDNSSYIPTLVTAANNAIITLLNQNLHNRISVVLYSGNSSTSEKANLSNATTILPLDRYTTGSNNKFLSYTGTSSNTTVTLDGNVKNSNGNKVSGSKETVGGTYIQAGLYLASKEFENASKNGTTVIDKDLFQGGTKRIPVITLMSDGLPTIATDQYCTFERSTTGQNKVFGVTNHGNGGSNTDTITFLTQLTAKWLKDSACNWYDNQALFYTVWVKSATDNSENATLKPSSSNSTIDGWWQDFLSASSGTVTFTESGKSFSVTRDNVIKTIPKVTPATDDYTAAWTTEQNYVDKAFTATNANDFTTAFSDIVNTIKAQSLRYPTLMTSSNANTDGYVTTEDTLGEYMLLKELKGISIGGNLYNGKTLVDLLTDNNFANDNTYTDEETLFIETVATRFGLTTDTAIAVIKEAIKYGQLGLNSQSNSYSNYIGFYADKNGKYLGAWQEGHTEQDIPNTATQIVKSFVFYDVIEKSVSDCNITGNNLTHLFVDATTRIDNGDRLIRVAIPASLLPQITYKASVNAPSLSAATSATLTVDGANEPIRILAEVGLRDDINELTVGAIMQKDGYTNVDSKGNYLFYTNRWDDGNFNGSEPFASHNSTVAHFQPSLNNPTYFYDNDENIYTDTKGTLYQGAFAPSGGTFYRVAYEIALSGEDNAATIEKTYHAISGEALAKAKSNGNNTWYIPAHTPLGSLKTAFHNKDINPTNTLSYVSSRPVPLQRNGVYNVYEQLGNNGLITVNNSRVLEIIKKLTETLSGTNTDNFVLNVEFTAPESVTLPQTVKVSYDGEKYVELDTDSVQLTLSKDQKVMIFGLPGGTTYTVTEEKHAYYTPVTPTLSGTLTYEAVTSVEYYNRPVYSGGVKVSKTVAHPFGSTDSELNSIDFSFKAELRDKNNIAMADRLIYTSKGSLTTDKSGIVSFNLKNNEHFTITDLPNGSIVNVSEINLPSGFTADSATKSYTVANGNVGEIIFTNTYSPASPKDTHIKITGTKILSGREWQDFDSFRFSLQHFNGTSWQTVAGGKDNTATKENNTFNLSDVINGFVFDREGDYHFRIKEEDGGLGGMTYDTDPRTFTVTVEDNWKGTYEVAAVTTTDPRINITTANNGVTEYQVEANFTNSYTAASAFIDLNGNKQLIGDDIANYTGEKAFRFNLYTAKKDNGKLVKDSFIISATEADGCFSFNHNNIPLLGFKTAGTYNFIISEAINGNDPLMVFDDTYYEIAVNVTDTLKGELRTDATITRVKANGERTNVNTSEITFVNTRKPEPIKVSISGLKLYNVALTENKFAFNLYKASLNGGNYIPQGDALITATNTADGSFVLRDTAETSALTFDKAGEYHFAVAENLPQGVTATNPKSDGITYDTTVYGVTVKVTAQTVNGRTTLSSSLIIPKNIVFSNHYNPFSPVSHNIKGGKIFAGKLPSDGIFNFELYKAKYTNQGFAVTGNAIDRKSTVNGVFTFDAFTYSSYEDLGEYCYAVKEVAPHDADQNNISGGVIYDASVYFIKITVTDNGNKTLNISEQIFLNDVAVNEISFNNRMVMPEPPPDDDESDNTNNSEPSNNDDKQGTSSETPRPDFDPDTNVISPQTGDTLISILLYILLAISGVAIIRLANKKRIR